ncbi:hypothetical protein NIES806_07030 [Dolichospermum compactum NIES-806]|uniref:Tryptophan-rich domain-containing protein n=1 Tax=Dolichospermum compactum NIES-806 TaxID=1973481 RepID=A0A1Z4UZA5_9CYAN|nr:hypothetical protein NIES806_07030 [Dolichospermum compactum NIES-806]
MDGFYHGGGGIYNGGQAILLGTTIKNNTADSGGGIQSSGTLTISNSTIYNNTARSSGGGIFHSGTTSLINSTVSGNQADYSGGIYASDGILNIFNSTITQNAADETYNFYVGGIDNSRASVNLKNSIVAGNIGGSPDLDGNINGNNNNLIGNLSRASGTVGTGTDIVNVNPKLGPLQDNGNGIFTHALLSGSPAINKGNNALITTDVFDIDGDGNNSENIPFDNRGSGYTRISGGTVDIGAFEFQPALVFTPIESAGNTKLVKDSTNKYFTQIGTNTPNTIKNGGQQIYQDIYSGWQTLAAETVNGVNQVLWKNVSGNFLHIWSLDSNWNWVSSEGQWALNSVDALTQETNFGIDANSDGVIGYTPIELAGNTKFIKDAANKYFTQIGTNTPNTIKNGGQQIYQDIYSGWQTLAAETVNGVNQVLWKNVSGNFLHIWSLDSNWNWVSSEGQWALNSVDALTQETNFGIDANSDGVIGYTPIELAGNTKFIKDAANKYFTQIGTNTPNTIKNGGQQIYQDIYSGWQTLAAETVNGVNQVLWKNVSGNFLHIWSLDSNWNWVSSEGQWALNSVDALTQETNFGIDANSDGVIGYTPIELAGNTKFIKDAANKYFTQIGTNTPNTIKNGGQQIYQDIYSGWQTLAAETVNGVNQVLWKNVSGNFLHIWSLDSNWNWVSSEGQWALNSADALTQETNFGIDANADGKIGNPFSLTVTGTSGNDFLVGGANNDVLTGAGGKDTLTGGLGSDKFVYQNLTDSLLANFDVITDFNATTGNDLFRVSTTRAGFVDVGGVNTLNAADIGAKLTAAAFGSNFAAQFSFGQKTFVAINDATAGFNSSTDAIIEITGLTGTLNINNFVIV